MPLLEVPRPGVSARIPDARENAPGLSIGDAVALALLFTALLVALRFGVPHAAGALGWPMRGLLPLLVAQLVAGPAVLTLGVRWSGLPWPAALTLRPFPLRVLPAVVVGSLGLAFCAGQLARLLPGVAELQQRVMADLGAGAPIVPVLTGIVLAPLLEEMLCRGVLLRGLLRRHSAWTAAVVTAVVFAFFHLTAPQGLVALPLGLGFAWLALRTGSIVGGIVGHAVVNSSSVLTAVLLLPRYTPEQIARLTQGSPPAPWLAMSAAAAVLGIAVTWWQLRDYHALPGDVVAAARPAATAPGPGVLRPALAITAAVLLLAAVPRASAKLWLRGLEMPESGPPSMKVLAAAGCYALDAPAAVAARLFPGAPAGPLPLRLSTTRYRVGIEHPSRYLVELLSSGRADGHAAEEPAAASGGLPPVYWLAPDGASVSASIVADGTLLRLRPRGNDLIGEATFYDSGGASMSAGSVTARRIPCPGGDPGR